MGLRVKEPITLFSGVCPEFPDLKKDHDPKKIKDYGKYLGLKYFSFIIFT